MIYYIIIFPVILLLILLLSDSGEKMEVLRYIEILIQTSHK